MCRGAAAGVMAELSEEALLSVLPTIRVPKAGDRVHKDECAFSFDTPVSPFPTAAASTTSFHRPGHSAGACKSWATASLRCTMGLVVSHATPAVASNSRELSCDYRPRKSPRPPHPHPVSWSTVGIVVAHSLRYRSKPEAQPGCQTTSPMWTPAKAWELALPIAHGSPGFVVSCGRDGATPTHSSGPGLG